MDSKMTKAKLPDYKAQKHLACNVKEFHPGKGSDLKEFMSNSSFGQSSRDYMQEQSHFGPPVIVEAHSDDLATLDIPDVLQSRFEISSGRMAPGYSRQLDNYKYFTDDAASVIIGQSVNPTDNSHIYSVPTSVTEKSPTQKKLKAKKQYETDVSAGTSSDCSPSPSTRTSSQGVSKDNLQNADESVACSVRHRDLGNKPTVLTNFAQAQSSQCQRNLHFHTNGESVVLIMERDSKFFFCGKLIVKVLYGVIELSGSVITTEDPPVKVYHPRHYCFSPMEVTGKEWQCDTDLIISLLLAEGIEPDFDTQTQKFQILCSTASAVLKLQNFEDHRTKFLSSLYGLKIFPKVESSVYYHWTDPRKAELALQCNFYFYDTDASAPMNVDPLVPTEITERIAYEWCTTGTSRTLLAGAKGVGKSATVRYLTNRLLLLSNKVVVVDLDIGQSEFLPCGCISYTLVDKPLLGPSFTHSNEATYRLYIGEISIMKCISRYVEGVKKLMDKLLSCPTLSKVPIVVNTMGFTYGVAWPLMILLIKIISPTSVLQIMSKQTKKNFPKLLSPANVNDENTGTISFRRSLIDRNKKCRHNVYMLQSQVERLQKLESDAWKMQPFERRDLMTVSYFGEALKEQIESTIQVGSGLPPTLNEAVPYVASMSSLCIAFSPSIVPPSQALTAINGNIVALCDVDLNHADVQRDRNSKTVPTVLIRAPISTCYGFGIVRGIDTEKGEIYITTPVSHSLMRYVNCLQGCHQVPDVLLQLNLPNAPYTGGVNTLPTSREHRRGYFRMRYEKQQTSD